jgi:hypothetical protein
VAYNPVQVYKKIEYLVNLPKSRDTKLKGLREQSYGSQLPKIPVVGMKLDNC